VELPAREPREVDLLDIERYLALAPLDLETSSPALKPPHVPKPSPPHKVIEALERFLQQRVESHPRPLKIGIKGPAASRKLLYAPPPPKVAVNVETEVVLKFWVKPDGTVGKVIPLKKGDTRLELAGMNFLKGCLFEPLPPGSPPREEWGTLVVRSVLK